jgi:hypothetical protein
MRTRLVVSGYWTLEPRWLQPIMTILLFGPTHVIMQMRLFHNVKRRAEAVAPGEPEPRSLSLPPSEEQVGGVLQLAASPAAVSIGATPGTSAS